MLNRSAAESHVKGLAAFDICQWKSKSRADYVQDAKGRPGISLLEDVDGAAASPQSLRVRVAPDRWWTRLADSASDEKQRENGLDHRSAAGDGPWPNVVEHSQDSNGGFQVSFQRSTIMIILQTFCRDR